MHQNLLLRFRRLFWTLDDPSLKTAIWVTTDTNTSSRSPTSQKQPYYDPTTETWHPLSQSSMFEPRISSVTVHASDFEEWESNCCEYHRHSEYPETSIDGARWGTIWDVKHVEEWGDDMHLLECCETQRPLGKDVRLLVKASSSEHGGGFITVHDFVATVHPWLMSLHSAIREAHALKAFMGDDPLPPGTGFLVKMWQPDLLWIQMQQDVNTIHGDGFKMQGVPIA
ncbi:hypothetical protein IFR05_015653 [Cadophora sp. M221]|nr:hypothetical protein IFR05_015653 [Cadophora sp. M221]